MIADMAFIKSEQQIQNQWSLHPKGGENLLVFRQQHWWVPASTIRGHPQSVLFLGEVVTGLVPSCCCICFFTIHRMLCTCCKHVLLSINYALKAIFPSSQGGICVGIISWLFVCSPKHLPVLLLRKCSALFLWEHFLCGSNFYKKS